MGVASYRSVKKYFVGKTESIQWRVFTKLTFITCETNYCCIIMSRNTTIIGKKELFEQSMNRVKFALDRSFFSNREPNPRPRKFELFSTMKYQSWIRCDSDTVLIFFFYGTGEDFLEQVLRLYTGAKFFLIKPRGIVCARAYIQSAVCNYWIRL